MSQQLEALVQRQRTFLADPRKVTEQVWVTSGVELLERFEADLRTERAKKDPNEAKVDELEKAIDKLRDQLYPDGSRIDAFPIHAVFMERRTSQTRAVSL